MDGGLWIVPTCRGLVDAQGGGGISDGTGLRNMDVRSARYVLVLALAVKTPESGIYHVGTGTLPTRRLHTCK